MLTFPPIPEAYLALLSGGAAAPPTVTWVDERRGLFTVRVSGTGDPLWPDDPEEPPMDTVVETAAPAPPHTRRAPSPMEMPSIPPERQSPDTPHCMHGLPSRPLVCRRIDSPNHGRAFYTCAADEGRCAIFRWQDKNGQYSIMMPRTVPALTGGRGPLRPLTHRELLIQTAVDAATQLQAWSGLRQGTDFWHILRGCPLMASNFRLVHHKLLVISPNSSHFLSK